MRRFQFFYFYVQNNVQKYIISAFLVLGGLTLGRNDLLDPAGHGVAELLEVLPADGAGPEDLQLLDQLGHGPNVLVLQLALHVAPAVLDRV